MAIEDKSDALARIEAAREGGIRFVQLQFTDILGRGQGGHDPDPPARGLASATGPGSTARSIEGFTRIAESDQYLMPDMETFAEIPWQPGSGPRGTARVICDVFTPRGEPFAGDPRFVLRRQVERARKLGYVVNTGPELEFFLFRRDEDGEIAPLPHDQAGYFDFSTDLAQEVRQDMVDALEAFGIRVEAAHHEVAAGQHEIDFEYADALKTADNAITFKFALKAIAQQHGLYATFMPKPIHGINGSGHAHPPEPVLDRRRAERVRRPERRRTGCRDVARVVHGRDPRPRPGHDRGPRAAREQLQAARPGLRGADVPDLGPHEPLARSSASRRSRPASRSRAPAVEVRCPDPSSNTYLAFAAMIAAGLDGVEKRPDPRRPGRGEPLRDGRRADRGEGDPRAAGHARRGASTSSSATPLIAEALGDHVLRHYV